jgi:hypothetical protein
MLSARDTRYCRTIQRSMIPMSKLKSPVNLGSKQSETDKITGKKLPRPPRG